MEPDLAKVDALCQAHGYPDQARSLLRDVTAELSVSGVRSVVLSGSGSRGELIYAESSSGLRWFSDLDLTVVADSLPAEQVASIEKRIAELEQRQLAIGAPTFHIDVDFTSSDAWQRPRRDFQAWETREQGWILFGEDMRGLIQVDVDSRTCVQSSLNRLWQLLLYLPEGVLRGQPTTQDREVFHYILDRAALDFPLWLLLEQGKLVAGFAGRLQFIEQHGSDLANPVFEIGDLLDLVRNAIQGRAAPGTERNLSHHYDEVLQWYVPMLQRSLARSEIQHDNLPETLAQEHAKIYPAIGLRRNLWELKLALEIAAGGKPLAALRWFGTAKQAKITGFLWAMHSAARNILADRPEPASAWLQRATADMHGLWPKNDLLTRDGDLTDSWVEQRLRFFDFVVQFYRGLAVKRSYYEFVLGINRS